MAISGQSAEFNAYHRLSFMRRGQALTPTPLPLGRGDERCGGGAVFTWVGAPALRPPPFIPPRKGEGSVSTLDVIPGPPSGVRDPFTPATGAHTGGTRRRALTDHPVRSGRRPGRGVNETFARRFAAGPTGFRDRDARSALRDAKARTFDPLSGPAGRRTGIALSGPAGIAPGTARPPSRPEAGYGPAFLLVGGTIRSHRGFPSAQKHCRGESP